MYHPDYIEKTHRTYHLLVNTQSGLPYSLNVEVQIQEGTGADVGVSYLHLFRAV